MFCAAFFQFHGNLRSTLISLLALLPALALADEKSTLKRCEKILSLLLTFAERNPGLTRLLTGDALTGETERLRTRIEQFFDRIETQLKQILREAELREGMHPQLPVAAAANLLIALVDGRIAEFVRTGFRRRPTDYWQEQWQLIAQGFLVNRDLPT